MKQAIYHSFKTTHRAHANAGVPWCKPSSPSKSKADSANAGRGPYQASPYVQRSEGGMIYGSYVDEILATQTSASNNDISGYALCANEWDSFALPSTCDVAYGAKGSFVFQSAKTGTIAFNNATFGDPAPGTPKKGYYRLSGGQRFYAHANSLYSVAALTNSAGAVVERYRYSSYGERTVLATDGITTRAVSSYNQQVGFTGRYLDKETGLWYFMARYYSGSLGRFIGRDRLTIRAARPRSLSGYKDGWNLYLAYFVPNQTDPSGLYTHHEHDNVAEGVPTPNTKDIPCGKLTFERGYVDASLTDVITDLPDELNAIVPGGIPPGKLGKMRSLSYVGAGFVMQFDPTTPPPTTTAPCCCDSYEWSQEKPGSLYGWNPDGAPHDAAHGPGAPATSGPAVDMPGDTFSGFFNNTDDRKYKLQLKCVKGAKKTAIYEVIWTVKIKIDKAGLGHADVTLDVPGW